MNAPGRRTGACLALLGAVVLSACNRDDPRPGAAQHDEASAEPVEPSNRIDIPSSVRSNLGISFVTVESRRIEQTLRVPGRFELQPTARREYRTMLPGRVELIVEQYQRVAPGDTLYRIDSPSWRDLQQQLSEVDSSIERLAVRLETFEPLMLAHEDHAQSLRASVVIWDERIEQLEELRVAGGGRGSQLTDARAAQATARAELAEVMEKEAALGAALAEAQTDLDGARSRRDFLLESAELILGESRDTLLDPAPTPAGEKPRWRTISQIHVRADEAGVVESLGLTNGSWADEKSPVLTVVQPDKLRFRASGLQSDLGVLREGLDARIVPPTPTASGRAVPLQDTMRGSLFIGLAGDADDRTIDMYVTPDTLSSWARPGVSAQLEIVTDSTATPELAIPSATVQRDGLIPVIFRRDPNDPDKAIRMEADLGSSDGRWVAVLSGLRAGDEIVLDGAFQLMLATSGSIQKGGHFHADGTFHEGED